MMDDAHDKHRAHALLWMLDHRGEIVHAEVRVARGDVPFATVAVDGVLHHWRDSSSAWRWEGIPRKNNGEGLFAVGEVSVDLTDIPEDAEVTIDDHEGELKIRLNEHIWLVVIRAEAAPT